MLKRSITAVSLAAVFVLPLAACSSNESGAPNSVSMVAADASAGDSASRTELSEVHSDGSSSTEVTNQGQSIIRNGAVSLSVNDVSEASESVNSLAIEMGGYVESASQYGANDGPARGADLMIRVPADRFDSSFDQLSQIGDVRSESRSAIDVTTEHVDLKARVAALEASVTRLTELMRGATSTSDLLEAEAALSQRQQELDGLNAQLKSLEGQVSLATIHVNLSTESVIPGGPGNFLDGIAAGWDALKSALAGAVVIAGVLLPWLIPLAILVGAMWWIARALRNRRRNAHTTGSQRENAVSAPAAATGPQAHRDDRPSATESVDSSAPSAPDDDTARDLD